MIDLILEILKESYLVLGQMSPYLLLGFTIAGILSVYVKPEWVEKNLGGNGYSSVIKASTYGVPLPLCSCGVIPVSASIRRHGASKAATTAFLLSTPQTGIDSIAVTYALLGPVFAVFRPIAAFLTGLLGGGIVRIFDNSPDNKLSSKETKVEVCEDDCCAPNKKEHPLLRVLKYGFVTLPSDIGVALLIGVFIAGIMSAVIPPDYLGIYIGSGVLSIVLMMIVGVPIYVCATASVPIAAGFIHMGASPGAALAFLIAGPATNAAAFTTMIKVLGKKTTALYLSTIAFSAIICGLILDWIYPLFNNSIGTMTEHHHESSSVAMTAIWSIVMILVITYSYYSKNHKGKTKMSENKDSASTDKAEEILEISVQGMNCSHCSESVRRTLAESPGVKNVNVDLKAAKATIEGINLDRSSLVNSINELGYTAS